MASSYPGALDSFTNPTSTDAMDASAALYHDVQHANANDAIEAVQAELGTDPAGGAATVKARLTAGLGMGIRHPAWPTASYYYYTGWVANGYVSNTAMTIDEIVYVPFWCPTPVTLAALVMNVTTLAAGNCRVGIYTAAESSGTIVPSALLVDAGTFDTSTTGYKEVATTQALAGDTLYFLASLFSAAPQVSNWSTTESVWGSMRYSTGSSRWPTWIQSYTYGTLPSSASGFTPGAATNDWPCIWVKL
jgi:hypothetical protein